MEHSPAGPTLAIEWPDQAPNGAQRSDSIGTGIDERERQTQTAGQLALLAPRLSKKRDQQGMDVEAATDHINDLLFQKVKGKGEEDQIESQDEPKDSPVKTPKRANKGKTAKPKPASVKSVKAKVAKASEIGNKLVKLALPFPGVPKKHKDAVGYKAFRIYTDLKQSMWRVKAAGCRKDKGCSWKSDPAAAWRKVNLVLTGQIKIPKD